MQYQFFLEYLELHLITNSHKCCFMLFMRPSDLCYAIFILFIVLLARLSSQNNLRLLCFDLVVASKHETFPAP